MGTASPWMIPEDVQNKVCWVLRRLAMSSPMISITITGRYYHKVHRGSSLGALIP